MDHAEAKKEAARRNANAASDESRFCPLLRSKCRTDCICWNISKPILSGTYHTSGKENYIVHGHGGCNNQMFWRECEVTL